MKLNKLLLLMKNYQPKLALGFLFCLVLNFYTFAQTPKYFVITGKIIAESESVVGGEIQITTKDKSAVSSQIPAHGRFRLELDYNSEYQLTFTQKGRMPKTIVVNTSIPEEVSSRINNFPNFLMAVKLFENNQEVSNIYYIGDQKQQIVYSAQQDCFVRVPTIFDHEYVDKGNSNHTQSFFPQEAKQKMQNFQLF